MAEMIEFKCGDGPVFVDPEKIDAVYWFDPFVASNGSCIAVNGVIVRVDEGPAIVEAKRRSALANRTIEDREAS